MNKLILAGVIAILGAGTAYASDASLPSFPDVDSPVTTLTEPLNFDGFCSGCDDCGGSCNVTKFNSTIENSVVNNVNSTGADNSGSSSSSSSSAAAAAAASAGGASAGAGASGSSSAGASNGSSSSSSSSSAAAAAAAGSGEGEASSSASAGSGASAAAASASTGAKVASVKGEKVSLTKTSGELPKAGIPAAAAAAGSLGLSSLSYGILALRKKASFIAQNL